MIAMRAAFLVTLSLLASALPVKTMAQGFAALVTPPRFELRAKAGETLRGVFELSNRSTAPTKFRVYTADWTLARDWSVDFKTELQPGSCRPWVAIERPEIVVPGGGRVRYRFDVAVPADASPGECRFAIMVEGADPSMAKGAGLDIPIAGRLGIIVYVNVGDTLPRIALLGGKVVDHNGRRVPAIVVRNDGAAHGRLFGFLNGRDAKGTSYELSPSDLPILPGETREVILTPSTEGNDAPVLAYPVTVTGRLEWQGGKVDLDQRFE
ncbi:MAG: hypothetical protein U1F41_06760 [Burkholderiales bacterium]